MKDEKMKTGRKCPICGKHYSAPPALSRRDNETEICPNCGTMEALDEIGASDEMKKDVLKKVRDAEKDKRGK